MLSLSPRSSLWMAAPAGKGGPREPAGERAGIRGQQIAQAACAGERRRFALIHFVSLRLFFLFLVFFLFFLFFSFFPFPRFPVFLFFRFSPLLFLCAFVDSLCVSWIGAQCIFKEISNANETTRLCGTTRLSNLIFRSIREAIFPTPVYGRNVSG